MSRLHLFAGANTANGFYSRYDDLLHEDYNRVYILKGGPGTGKSTLLKKIAANFQQSDVIRYHCSADIKSLDGIYLSGADITVLDGTAPHTCEPRIPGAVHQIIDLSNCWNPEKLRTERMKISDLSRKISGTYKSAYKWLAISAGYADIIQDNKGIDYEAKALHDAAKIIEMLPGLAKGRTRHAFASAVSGNGLISFLPILQKNAPVKILLVGNNRNYNNLVLRIIRKNLEGRKIPAAYLYCGLQPQYLEHIYIQGELGIFSSHSPHQCTKADYIFGPPEEDSWELHNLCAHSVDQAIALLAQARTLHMEMEKLYTPHVDFAKVESIGNALIKEILRGK